MQESFTYRLSKVLFILVERLIKMLAYEMVHASPFLLMVSICVMWQQRVCCSSC
jgi:hypothetical protein